MEIVYTKNFIHDLDEIAAILYNRKYYSYFEDIETYLFFIYNSIENGILLKRKRKNPDKTNKNGEFYITVNPNRRTTWYIFFDQFEDVYKINAIFNNHIHAANKLKGK